jgi:DNA-directed RNA polymerase
MSATGCVEAGLTFASVHDSYWTHACDVEIMNEVLRNQFIALHSNNIMKNLQTEFMERYKDYVYPVTLVIANPGEEVGEGMIAWDDERLRRRYLKPDATTVRGDEEEFLADPSEPLDEPMTSDTGKKTRKSRATKISSKSIEANVFEFGDDEEDEHDLSSVVIDEDEEELEAEARAMGKALRKKGGATKKKAANKLFHSWDPISFPPLPDKGEFDVRNVAESDYFFS